MHSGCRRHDLMDATLDEFLHFMSLACACSVLKILRIRLRMVYVLALMRSLLAQSWASMDVRFACMEERVVLLVIVPAGTSLTYSAMALLRDSVVR